MVEAATKPFFSYVKSKTKNRVGVGPLKDPDGNLVSTSKEMASMLNGYFSSVFSPETDRPPDIQEMKVRSKLETINISTRKVQKKISELKPDSAPGPDGLLQGLADEISPVLSEILE